MLMLNFLNTRDLALLQKGLDAIWLRQTVIADNIANIDTPHYKAKYVEFESVLQSKMGGLTSAAAVNSIQPRVITDNTTQARYDGNNVDIDQQGIESARAKIQYDYMVQKLTNEFARLKYAITEGKG